MSGCSFTAALAASASRRLQIARWRGARAIVTAGSHEKRALTLAFGAEHAFNSAHRLLCRRCHAGDRRARRLCGPEFARRRGHGAQSRTAAAVRPLRRTRQARLSGEYADRIAPFPTQPQLLRRRPRPVARVASGRVSPIVRRRAGAVRRRATSRPCLTVSSLTTKRSRRCGSCNSRDTSEKSSYGRRQEA